jgi:hypothetical protein
VLAASGPGTFGELDTTGARSVVRRYADAWFAAARRRRGGDLTARFPRRRRRMVPVGCYHGTFRLDGRVLQIPVARTGPPRQPLAGQAGSRSPNREDPVSTTNELTERCTKLDGTAHPDRQLTGSPRLAGSQETGHARPADLAAGRQPQAADRQPDGDT